MSLTSTDFWVLFDFALAEIMYVFALADSVVIVEDPRFTIWSAMISILFLGLVIGVINWLRGYHGGSGGTTWDYIMRKTPNDTNWENSLGNTMNDYVEVGSKGLPKDRLGRGTLHEEFKKQEDWNQSFKR